MKNTTNISLRKGLNAKENFIETLAFLVARYHFQTSQKSQNISEKINHGSFKANNGSLKQKKLRSETVSNIK